MAVRIVIGDAPLEGDALLKGYDTLVEHILRLAEISTELASRACDQLRLLEETEPAKAAEIAAARLRARVELNNSASLMRTFMQLMDEAIKGHEPD